MCVVTTQSTQFMKKDNKFTISQICKYTGLTKQTIRYYRELDLLSPIQQDNSYFLYDKDELLVSLHIHELKEYGIKALEIKDNRGNKSLPDMVDYFEEEINNLDKQIEDIMFKRKRILETYKYFNTAKSLKGKVEKFKGPATWAIPILDENTDSENVKKWTSRYPFVYTSLTIRLEDLESGNYNVELGVGSLIHYVEKFELPLGNNAIYQDGGEFIRTTICVDDVDDISKDSLKVLYDYIKENNYHFSTCTGGRLLFIDKTIDKPKYCFLIWVGIKPNV